MFTGNPYPKLTSDQSSNRNLIHNVLLDEAKKEFRAQKYAEMAEQITSQDKVAEVEDIKSDPISTISDTKPSAVEEEPTKLNEAKETPK